MEYTTMLWIKALHIIFIVTWFAGLFYLPRLFVYHADCSDDISNARFKLMERRLYYGIATPSAIFATLFGIWLLTFNWPLYLHAAWMHLKLSFVFLVWCYHIYAGYLLHQFFRDKNRHSSFFYRWFNEISVVMLIAIVILVVVKPF